MRYLGDSGLHGGLRLHSGDVSGDDSSTIDDCSTDDSGFSTEQDGQLGETDSDWERDEGDMGSEESAYNNMHNQASNACAMAGEDSDDADIGSGEEDNY